MTDTQSHFSLIETAITTSLPEKALEILGSLPEYASSYLLKAKILKDLGRIDEARSEAEKALKLAPNSPGAALLLDEMIVQDAKPGSFAVLFRSPKPALAARDEAGLSDRTDQTDLTDDGPETISGLVSETLAGIMVQQAKLVEAKKVYIQLARENPERYEYYSKLINDLDSRLQLAEGKAHQ